MRSSSSPMYVQYASCCVVCMKARHHRRMLNFDVPLELHKWASNAAELGCMFDCLFGYLLSVECITLRCSCSSHNQAKLLSKV